MAPASAASAPRRLDPERLGDHLDRLFRVARSMCGRREDADDLVQETYAQVLARPRWVRREDDFGYLLGVLRNTYVTRLRIRDRRPSEVPLELAREPADDRAPWRPGGSMEIGALLAAIAALPEPFREPLVLVDVAGLSYREAGDALGVREATVTTRLHRARQRVAAELDRDELAAA